MATSAEQSLLREAFAASILGDGDVDADVYAHWGAEPLRGSDGRVVWAVYFVKGYGFTLIEFWLGGTFADAGEVARYLHAQGRFGGAAPPDTCALA